MRLGFLCRYGHQSIQALLGRRPSAHEEALLMCAIQNYIEIEYQKPDPKPGEA